VAEALEELPVTQEALEQGELCWSAVRELTRVATPETEAEWLAVTRRRNAHEVEQMVRGHGRGDRPSDPVSRQTLDKVLRFELSGSRRTDRRGAQQLSACGFGMPELPARLSAGARRAG
jgi:hypothetical protein